MKTTARNEATGEYHKAKRQPQKRLMKRTGKERKKRARMRDAEKIGRLDQRSWRGTGEVEDQNHEGRCNGGVTIEATGKPGTLRRKRRS